VAQIITVGELMGGRRGGKFLPTQIAGGVAWYRKGTGIVTGAGVSNWPDAFGLGRDLLQGTDAARPALQADGTVLFNGTSHFLETGAMSAIAQPSMTYLAFKQVTYTNTDIILDSQGRQILLQAAASPNLEIYNGIGQVATNGGLAINTYGVIAVLWSGAGSTFRINNNAPTTGNPGVDGTGTNLTMGAVNGGATQWSNIQVKEVILYSGAHTTAQQNAVINYLSAL